MLRHGWLVIILILLLPAVVSAQEQAGSLAWLELQDGQTIFYSTASDSAMMPAIVRFAKDGVARVTAFFDAPFAQSCTVRVFPTRATLTAHWRQAWGAPDFEAQCWMVASGSATELALLSPLRWPTEACEHDWADSLATKKLIAHELAHVYHGQRLPKQSFDGLDSIGWFIEGLAVLVSGQLETGRLASPREAIEQGKAPAQLEDAWSGKYRYGVSGSLVHYIDTIYGRSTTAALLAAVSEAEILTKLQLDEATLLQRWRDFVLAQETPKNNR